MKKLLTPLLAAAIAPFALHAEVLMFDFGPTTTTAPSNSPYHTAAGSGFTDTSWNKIQTADSSSLVYSNGTTATGVGINIGTSTGTSAGALNTIDLANTPSGNSQLATIGTGIYGSGSVGTDGIFHSSGTVTSRNLGSVGVQITGLSIGTYTLYISGRNTNITDFGTGGNQGQLITAYAGVGTAGDNFTIGSGSGYASGSNNFLSTTNSTSWVAGENYIQLTVSITSLGQALNLGITGGGDAGGTTKDNRGFLNSLQIVNTSLIPEPSTYAAMGGVAALGFASLRRRKRA